jgi:putative GTP pyrophosphokinase
MAPNADQPAGTPDRAKLHAVYKRHRGGYDSALRKVDGQVQSLLTQHGINATIQTRIKSFESYFEKILKLLNNYTEPVVLTDMIGIRVICPFLEDLVTAEKVLSAHLAVLEVDRKSETYSFREFGYDSTHLLFELPPGTLRSPLPYTQTVCECQLRTILQEAWSEVEHELVYKGGISLLNDAVKRKLASLNATLTLSDIIFQEIRDFQKTDKEQRESRKRSVHDTVQVIDRISLVGASEVPVADEPPRNITFPVGAHGKAEGLILEALDLHGNGRYNEAVATYTRVIEMDLEPLVQSMVLNHRGMAWFVLAEYTKAIRDFTEAVDLDSRNFQALNNRGLALRMTRNYKEALADLDASMEILAHQSEGHHIRALIHYDLHEFEGALADCEAALNIRPDHAAALRLLSEIRHHLAENA